MTRFSAKPSIVWYILDTLARVSQWVRCNIARSRWRGAKHATTTINPTLNESVFKVSDGFQSNEVERLAFNNVQQPLEQRKQFIIILRDCFCQIRKPAWRWTLEPCLLAPCRLRMQKALHWCTDAENGIFFQRCYLSVVRFRSSFFPKFLMWNKEK